MVQRLAPELGAFPGAPASCPVLPSLVLSDLGLFICQVGIRIPAHSVSQGKSRGALRKGKRLVNDEGLGLGYGRLCLSLARTGEAVYSRVTFTLLLVLCHHWESPGGWVALHTLLTPRATPGARSTVQPRNPPINPACGTVAVSSRRSPGRANGGISEDSEAQASGKRGFLAEGASRRGGGGTGRDGGVCPGPAGR